MGTCETGRGTLNAPMIGKQMSAVMAGVWVSASLGHAMEVREQEGRVEVLENGKVLTALHAGRVPYLFPLPSSSGANLSRYWPIEDGVAGEEQDHPHHRSMWFSHGAVNGYDFWAWTGKGEPKIRLEKVRDLESAEDQVAFTVDLAWEADGKVQLTEERHYRIARPDAETLWIDLRSTLTAPADEAVLLGDTKEGTCAVRVDRTLRLKGPTAQGGILDSEGRTDFDSWGKRSKWVAFHGPDEKGEPAVVAMFDHPGNLRFPSWWHARDYGLLAANPFGIHDFESGKPKGSGDHRLPAGESLTFRYRILLHHGELTGSQLESTWEQFAAAAEAEK